MTAPEETTPMNGTPENIRRLLALVAERQATFSRLEAEDMDSEAIGSALKSLESAEFSLDCADIAYIDACHAAGTPATALIR